MNGAAFDAAAASYDAEFTDRQLGRWLRERVQKVLADSFHAGDHVLDIGCGTGEDAVWLAQRGVRVTGVDGSSQMLATARAKAVHAGQAAALDFHQADLAANNLDLAVAVGYDKPVGTGAFDGAYSNFGVVNCVPDRGALAGNLGHLVRPRGRLVLVVMGPFCACETAGHLLRGRLGAAFRRVRNQPHARIGSESLPVWYPSVGHLRREFDPWFQFLGGFGVGVTLPPSEFSDFVDRWPRLFAAMAALERRMGRTRATAWLSDHHVTMFERR